MLFTFNVQQVFVGIKHFLCAKIAKTPSVDLALTQTRNAQKLFVMIVLQQIVKVKTNLSFYFVRGTFNNK